MMGMWDSAYYLSIYTFGAVILAGPAVAQPLRRDLPFSIAS